MKIRSSLCARLLGIASAAMLTLSAALSPAAVIPHAAAISTDYPPQLINIAAKDGSAVLTETGTADNSALTVKALGSDLAPSWRFDRVGNDSNGTFFKLCNAESGRLLTPQGYKVNAGAKVVVYGSESAKSQHWYVIPVKNDRLGNGLYYKIVNYENTGLALTQGSGGLTLESYSGADNQLWLLNSDGLQGFAGYCTNDQTGSIKAADIGGLFGEVVEVNNFNDLKKYATADSPYTIVVTGDIKVTNLQKDSSGRYYCPDGRIYVHSNKTIIGSYAKHTMYNVQFCTSSKSGTGNNLIIKNFDLQHDKESNGNDSIVVYFGSGENLWVDHCTFTGHSDYNTASTGLPDYDKFLACCYDADYCTVSDTAFGLHEYGLILGYPDDTADVKNKYDNFPRMSIISNKFQKTLTRGPGLMRWGYFHSLCNYVNTFSMAYTVHSGCDIFAENCYYENGGNVICDWNQITYPGAYAESGSKFSGCSRTKQGEGTANNPSTSKPSSWRPGGNYAYTAISADAAKSYCSSYSAAQSSSDKMMYLRFAKAGIPSAGFTEAPGGGSSYTAAEFAEGTTCRFRNVNSGLFMQIADGNAANGANIQQWGTDGESLHDIWKLISAGDGYYYIASALDDNYVLDVAGRKTDNGTNIDLYQRNDGTNQQFMLTENGDGSYKIRTRVSGEASAVEIENAYTNAGANVQQWEINGANCQDWELIPAAIPVSGRLVRNLVVLDAERANGWGGIADNTAVGASVFGDRDFTLTAIPEELMGAEQIITACDSKNAAGDLASFTAAADITVYVALDQRVTSIPAWLTAYTKTAGTVDLSNNVRCDLYALNADAGTKIILGTNGQNGGVVNYTVFAAERKAVTTTTTTLTTTTTTTTATTTTETVTTTTLTSTTVSDEPQTTLRGDVNDDGAVDVKDAVMLARYVGGDATASLTEKGERNAELDGKAGISPTDLTTLLRALARLITL